MKVGKFNKMEVEVTKEALILMKTGENWEWVIPELDRIDFMVLVHDTGGHQGINKTKEQLR